MKILQLLACGAVVVAVQPVMAHQVNACIDAQGRKVMTDRPCENPAVEHERDKQRKVRGVGVEQVRAPDIFETRTKIDNNGKPISTDSSDDAGKSQGR
ncbi:DUF4124 domain-containing protein [Variovorax sp. dw_954]|uniref:DUF4124 domain-containing protein n=1 Tax=Variovorax sp. dw_954 TaxID=2720078 RepID=UPI001BD513BD|nr:DUF4124 domain-containing protein [Variovorax sp. dw_954]